MNKKFLAIISLMFTAMIWGLGFVAQRAGMEFVGPFTFNAVRSFLGGLSLLSVIWLVKSLCKDSRTVKLKKLQHILLAKAGLACGGVLFIAISIQQFCMQYVGAGKGGFISALYIIFVPIISVFMGKRLPNNVIFSILLAVIGLYLLCFKENLSSFNHYDFVLLSSTLFYALHIILVNFYSQKLDPAKLCCVQFFIVGILSLPLMFIFEAPTILAIWACRYYLLFAGVLTCGIAYTLQIFGQKYTPPVVASLIMSLESVFAVIGGMLFLNEILSGKEFLGCLFMVIAVLLSQLKFSPAKLKPCNTDG